MADYSASAQLEALIARMVFGVTGHAGGLSDTNRTGDILLYDESSGPSMDSYYSDFTGAFDGSGGYTNGSGNPYVQVALASADPASGLSDGKRWTDFTELSGNGYARVTDDANGSGYIQWRPLHYLDITLVGSSTFAVGDTITGDTSSNSGQIGYISIDGTSAEVVLKDYDTHFLPSGDDIIGNGASPTESTADLADENSNSTIITNAYDLTFPTASGGAWTTATHAVILYDGEGDNDGDSVPLIACALASSVTVADTETLTIGAGKLRFSIA